MKNFKININSKQKGGALTANNTSNPVDAHFSTGSLEQPSKTEFKNSHGCPFVSHRNGGENDVKTMVGASEQLAGPNEDNQIQKLINNCHHWTKYKNTYQKDLEVFHLDKMGNKIYGCKLFEAFPTTLNPIEMGNANTDQATEYNVQLSYTTWKPIYFGQEGQKKPPPTSAAKEDFRRKEAAGIPTYPTY